MKHTLSPHEAAIAFQQGEEAGFNYFFNQLYGLLAYYSFRIVNDSSFAEDIVCRSFVKIWRRREKFTHPLVIRSWLYSTVRNDSLNTLRKEKKISRYKIKLLETTEEPFQESHQEAMIRAEVVTQTHKMLEPLPTKCKKIITMYYFQGKNTMEIAKALKLSVSTVKNHKLRGEAMMRKVAETGYTSDFQKESAELYRKIRNSPLTIAEAAIKYGMSETSIINIRMRHVNSFS